MSRRNFRGIISSSKLTVSNVSASGIFTTNSHLQVKNSGNWPTIARLVVSSVEYLVVSGGGSGAGYGLNVGAGGGGAGGLLTGNTSVSGSVTYTVTVGAGGAGVASNLSGNYGSNTSISGTGVSISTIGGGRGTFWRTDGPGNGGSGGGTTGGTQSSAMISGKGIYPGSTYLSQTRQGYDGGLGVGDLGGTACTGGGGGGAGGAGATATGVAGGAGGTGFTSSISGTSTTYASGGNGSAGSFSSGVYSSTPGAGGGGAAGGGYSEGGGNGIVILRYLDTFPAATSTTGSPTITTAGGYRIYTWTSSGSITF